MIASNFSLVFVWKWSHALGSIFLSTVLVLGKQQITMTITTKGTHHYLKNNYYCYPDIIILDARETMKVVFLVKTVLLYLHQWIWKELWEVRSNYTVLWKCMQAPWNDWQFHVNEAEKKKKHYSLHFRSRYMQQQRLNNCQTVKKVFYMHAKMNCVCCNLSFSRHVIQMNCDFQNPLDFKPMPCNQLAQNGPLYWDNKTSYL